MNGISITDIQYRIAVQARQFAREYFYDDAELRHRSGVKAPFTFEEALLRQEYGSPTTGEIEVIPSRPLTH